MTSIAQRTSLRLAEAKSTHAIEIALHHAMRDMSEKGRRASPRIYHAVMNIYEKPSTRRLPPSRLSRPFQPIALFSKLDARHYPLIISGEVIALDELGQRVKLDPETMERII